MLGRRVNRFAVLVGLSVVALGPLGVSSAANLTLAGNPDPSFGSGGVVTHTPGGDSYPSVDAIVVQPDGKIVAAGNEFLARYLPDGAPDPSFGEGGYVTSSVSAAAVALLPDGKIVVAGDGGTVEPEFALARFNPSGAPDTSFGTDGVTTTPVPVKTEPAASDGAWADALAILPDGGILVGGSAGWLAGIYAGGSVSALVRYEPDGSLDSAFGDGGVVESGASGFASSGIDGLLVQSDGGVVASGGAEAGGTCGPCQSPTETMAVWRYEPNGALDPTFEGGNPSLTDTRLKYDGGPSTLQGAKIVVAGFTHRNHPVLERLKADGEQDTFGTHGFAAITSVTGEPTAVLAQSDRKLLVSVTTPSLDQQTNTTAVIRLLPNGRLDPSFGSGGIVRLGQEAHALALQADQKVLVGGGSGHAWVLDRLLAGNNCVVPGLRGKTLAKASSALKRSYCGRGRISKRSSKSVARGRVISTAPRRGARLPGGAPVDLVVSSGPRR
jgi:uncharacterized delta-60 repeat protein